MNVCIFAGRVGRDPIVRALPDGTPLLSFSLAVDTYENREKGVMWVDVSMAGKHAQAISSYLAKGDYATVSGQVGVRKYKSKDGTEQVAVRLSAFKCTLQGKRAAAAAIPAVVNPARPAQPYPQEDGFAPDAGSDIDDDIPF